MHQFFFSLLILFLPTQLGYHVWPQWAMVLGRRVDYLSPTLFFTDILVAFTLCFWALSQKRLRLPKIHRSHWFALVVFAIVVGINIFFAQSKPVAIYHWIKYIEFTLLGLYIVKTKFPSPTLFFLLSIGILYSAVIAIVQFFFQHSIGGPMWFLGERSFTVDTPGIARIALGGKEWIRSYGTFPHPNVLGGFLATVLPVVIYHWSGRKKIFFWATIILGIAGIVTAFSRSAWIIFALGVLWVWQKKKQTFWIPLIAGISMILLFFFIPLSPVDESVVVRHQLNDAAIQMFQSSPLYGVGLGNFLVTLPDHLPSRTIYFLQPVHNIYLLLLSEIGIIGITFLAGILHFLFKKKIFVIHLSPVSYPIIAFFLLGLIDHYPLTLQQGRLLFTLFIAMFLSKGKR